MGNTAANDLFEYTGLVCSERKNLYEEKFLFQRPPLKPILKWAGGKTQMLDSLLPHIPLTYGKYIEPFFGGGALFFAVQPDNAVISDSNPELINMYRQIADHADEIISCLYKYENTRNMFYTVRNLDWQSISAVEAAARTIYLNKTCFNGLYRVNKNGFFNVPFGNYTKPKICDPNLLRKASAVLKKATIVQDDYIAVLEQYAKSGDFIFLDPPYLPISKYSDFKRYTKEQFQEKDHIELARLVKRLYQKGCYVILTNSNHPLVHELYSDFELEVVQTKRYISCNGNNRNGEDVIVKAFPPLQISLSPIPPKLSSQTEAYPSTRFMGSKNKLLTQIWDIASQFQFRKALDLFAGSGIVGYMLKSQGKSVISNDYMAMSAMYTKAMIENNNVFLSDAEAENLLLPPRNLDHFIEDTFHGLYYTDNENRLIDILRCNIAALQNPYKRAIAMSALIRACIKKRPRGIFTYIGNRYDDGRKDLQKSLEQQFFEAVTAINNAVFDNGYPCKSVCGDAMNFYDSDVDLVYIDPPYYSPLSDNEYVRRYHFVEGLARNWKGLEIQTHTKTKKFKSFPTPFSSKSGAVCAFDALFNKFAKSILIVSYSSNSQPTKDEILVIMEKYKHRVSVIPIDYKYSFGNQSNAQTHRNDVQEYLFVGY